MTFLSRDFNAGVELADFHHYHPKRGILGYNGIGLGLDEVDDLTDP